MTFIAEIDEREIALMHDPETVMRGPPDRGRYG